MISHIHATTIIVEDQEKALDFYVNVLGWDKADDSQMGPHMRWLTVVPPGAKTQLVLGHASWIGEGKTLAELSGSPLVTPDIDETVATLTERGVKFKGTIEDMPWGGRAIWFSDIDSNEFFLVSE